MAPGQLPDATAQLLLLDVPGSEVSRRIASHAFQRNKLVEHGLVKLGIGE